MDSMFKDTNQLWGKGLAIDRRFGVQFLFQFEIVEINAIVVI
jgi:hypothetical protein